MWRSGLRAKLTRAFAPGDDPYAGGNLELAQRLGRMLAAASTLIALVLMPFAPPTAALGHSGWIVCSGLVLISVASVIIERHTGEYTWNKILLLNYLGIAQIGLAQWLAGPHAPYRELFLLTTVYVAGVHPPRRAAGFLTTVGIVTLAPLFFTPWDPMLVASVVGLVLIWSALAVVVATAQLAARMDRLGNLRESQAARVDQLTGLGNRRAFDEVLVTEIARARRSGSALSLLLGDLDRFKELNDHHGHLAGDRCLREVAAVFRDTIRLQDRCFRWGGDEFAAVVTDTGIVTSELVVGRVEVAVSRQCREPDGEPVSLTCAFALLENGMSADDLLAAADRELLAKKESRRAPGGANGAAASSAGPAAPPAAS
jgi:diguanylate cyclase (GGDEF)-like protein